MDLILNMEQKFAKINNKLDSNSKIELINNNYSKDFEAIHSLFDSTKEKKYENGLNERRDEMLRQINQKIDEQLEQVNEFSRNNTENHIKELNKLRKLSDSIESSYVSFSRSLISVYESILARAKLQNPLNLLNLIDYWPLMRNENHIILENANNLLQYANYSLFVLPLNQILLCSNSEGHKNLAQQTKLVIQNKNGDLIRSKALNSPNYLIRANATNIIAYDRDNFRLEIYNFKLELVHTRTLTERNCFYLNDYDIIFYDKYDSCVLSCYNYKTVQFKSHKICLDKSKLFKLSIELNLDEAERNFRLALLALNERFIFIQVYVAQRISSILFILNRSDGNSVLRHFVYKTSPFYFTMYNKSFCMLNYYNGMPKLKVYDQDSADGLICVFDGNVSEETCKVVHLAKVLTRI